MQLRMLKKWVKLELPADVDAPFAVQSLKSDNLGKFLSGVIIVFRERH